MIELRQMKRARVLVVGVTVVMMSCGVFSLVCDSTSALAIPAAVTLYFAESVTPVYATSQGYATVWEFQRKLNSFNGTTRGLTKLCFVVEGEQLWAVDLSLCLTTDGLPAVGILTSPVKSEGSQLNTFRGRVLNILPGVGGLPLLIVSPTLSQRQWLVGAFGEPSGGLWTGTVVERTLASKTRVSADSVWE